MTRRSPLERARMNLAQAVTRSAEDNWLATDQHLTRARKLLFRADREDLAKRVNHARGVGATNAGARAEMREVMQLIDADEQLEESIADTDPASFETREVSQ